MDADVFGEKAAKKKRRPSVVDRMRTQTRPDDDALDGEDFVENPDGETGAEPEREPFDYYFLYTVAAMQKVGTQYHDGHTEYSKFVREALERLSVLLYMIDVHLTCTKCRDTRPPGDKLWPILRMAVDAFGKERVMWASDHSVNQRGESWADLLYGVKACPLLSAEELEWVLGKALRGWIGWAA